MIFVKNRLIFTLIASVITPVKQNQLTFSNIEINKPLPPVQCLADKVQVQKPILVLATDQIRCLITLSVESSIISIDSNTTDNIIQKVINV